MDENMPIVVMSVVIAMIMLAVGAFAFYITTSEIGYESSQTQTFTVTDPTVANSWHLKYTPTSVGLVQQYNGIEWITVSSIYYSTDGQIFTILPGGMQG